MEVTSLPGLSVEEPQSVPSRISVVLVEEAKVRGTKCLGCPHVDQDLRMLAVVANPASVTVCEDSYISPCVGGCGPRLTLLLGALRGRCPHPTLPGCCFRLYLLGYHSQ